MTSFSTKLLDFDLPFYQIDLPEYDPIKDITDFWNLYDLESCRNYMMALSEVQERSSEINKQNLKVDQIEVSLIAITCLIIAYYVANIKGLDFRRLDLSILNNYEPNKKSLEINKLIYALFNGIATKQTNYQPNETIY